MTKKDARMRLLYWPSSNVKFTSTSHLGQALFALAAFLVHTAVGFAAHLRYVDVNVVGAKVLGIFNVRWQASRRFDRSESIGGTAACLVGSRCRWAEEGIRDQESANGNRSDHPFRSWPLQSHLFIAKVLIAVMTHVMVGWRPPLAVSSLDVALHPTALAS